MTNEKMRAQNIDAFSRGLESWKKYIDRFSDAIRQENRKNFWDLSAYEYIDKSFEIQGQNIETINCDDCTFSNCTFSAHFQNSNYRNCIFRNCTFKGGSFQSSQLENSLFLNCTFINFSFFYINNPSTCKFKICSFNGFNFVEVNLKDSLFDKVAFESGECKNCTWENVTFTKYIPIKGVSFLKSPTHSDYADTIKSTWINNLTNWSTISGLGRLPLFEVSWITFLIALFIIGFIGHLNETQFIKDIIGYPVKLPERFLYILSSSFLLILGTLLYKLRCPKNIQEFPEQKWVEEINKPRQIYFNESLIYPWSRFFCATSLVLGVLISLLGVIAPQIIWAFSELF